MPLLVFFTPNFLSNLMPFLGLQLKYPPYPCHIFEKENGRFPCRF